ncbi:YhfG family protein [Alloalcanivorax venustensis]|jgi:hypothetical protein|uniref:YhfG family protein n=1 Tax=Alloalcanivorax venustensis TaxID=172371 RepID=UPI0007932558|nr:MAG: hypothetical protein AXW13_00175 [Alcanivorax sp. Nap_24]
MADKTLTLKAKKSYYARFRGSNFRASLRLEGFQVSDSESVKPLPSRQAVIEKYRAKVKI